MFLNWMLPSGIIFKKNEKGCILKTSDIFLGNSQITTCCISGYNRRHWLLGESVCRWTNQQQVWLSRISRTRFGIWWFAINSNGQRWGELYMLLNWRFWNNNLNWKIQILWISNDILMECRILSFLKQFQFW